MWYTSLVQMPEGTLSTYLSSNCCKTAKRESGSFLQPQGPSLRFLPQRKQIPLQSGLHRSWLSMSENERCRHDVGPDRRSRHGCRRPIGPPPAPDSASGTRTAWTGYADIPRKGTCAAVTDAVQRRAYLSGQLENACGVADASAGQNRLACRAAAAEYQIGQIFACLKRTACTGYHKNRL